MYSTNDVGNICIYCLLICVGFGLLGLREIWPMVGALLFLIFVSIMLHK